ncbi:MAG TPA: tripartite tricarboxylate transporter substrate binding protein [Alphaproteobacteria bacterium]|nr:tripartite tricarboxylate transporter substrate binding protein [Alphaproteobacteria bacterium]
MTTILSRLAGLTLVLFAALAAHAESWPSRPVRLVVPYGAGGTADFLGRIAADQLTKAFGQQFVVENRPGAGGIVGSDFVAHAAPDGYTLEVSGVASHIMAPALRPDLTFDPVNGFTHIVLLGGPPDVIAVSRAISAKTFPDLVAQAKATAGGLSYGTAGIGAHGQLVCELLQKRAGFHMTHVPYRGGGPAIADLVAGHVPVACLTLTTASAQLRAGTIHAVAISTAHRLEAYPDIATFAELGYPDLTASTWFALSGPAGLPADIVGRINTAVIEALRKPEVRALLDRDAIEAEPLSPAEFTAFFKAEAARWTPFARASGATAD